MSDDDWEDGYDSDDGLSTNGSVSGESEHDDEAPQPRKVTFRILKKADILNSRKEAIDFLSSILGLTSEDAARVLRKCRWDPNRAQEDWFNDMEAVKTAVGLQRPTANTAPPKQQETCMVCFEEFPVSQMHSAACHHYFCTDCWQGYVSTAIAQGPASLDLRCPTPKCGACVPREVVRAVVEAKDWEKYETYELRSFVEDNRHMCWCVGKGCAAAVRSTLDHSADEPVDVQCSECQCDFCFGCKEEAHRPVGCDIVKQWIIKNGAESMNVLWIVANTKKCPKCKLNIEKNQGCMHMTCSQCKHQFCWICAADWNRHTTCNRFEAGEKEGSADEEERKRQIAKSALDRYTHYFQRWNDHQKARSKARHDIANTVKIHINTLSDHTKIPTSQLSFIQDAWEQIVDCRRVLSWTYTYAYYKFDPDNTHAATKNQQAFFEFLQADAERSVDRLHELAENQLKQLNDKLRIATAESLTHFEQFQAFREKVLALTDITGKYFDKLVQQLEKGFDGMEAEYAGRTISAAKQFSEEKRTTEAVKASSNVRPQPQAAV